MDTHIEHTDTLLSCPICRGGEGPRRFTTASLADHLESFHRRVDAWDLVGLALETAALFDLRRAS